MHIGLVDVHRLGWCASAWLMCIGMVQVVLATTATAHGLEPALIRAISVLAARSTTDTSLEGPLAVYRNFPSGDSAIPQGRTPTLIVFSNSYVRLSSTETVPARPLLT